MDNPSQASTGDPATAIEIDEDTAGELLPTYREAVKNGYASFSMVASARFIARGVIPDYPRIRAASIYYYPQLVDAFVRAHGYLVHVFWCRNFAGALAVTERRRRRGPWARVERQMHGVCSTSEPLVLRKLGAELDQLIVESRRLLTGEAQKVAIDKIYSVGTGVWAQLDARQPGATDPAATSSSLEAIAAALKSMVHDARTYLRRAAERKAQGYYLAGMLIGLSLVVGVAIPLRQYADVSFSSLKMTTMLGSLLTGGLGAVLSVLSRLSGPKKITLDWEAGTRTIFALGVFRPIVGGLFADVAYLFLKAGVISLAFAASDTLYWAVGFLAGFAERFVPDMLAGTQTILGTDAQQGNQMQEKSTGAGS